MLCLKRLIPSFVSFVLLICILTQSQAQTIIPGAYRLDKYLPLLHGRKVALLINQTSVVGKQSLLDTLLHSGVDIVKIFAPEHGFRGKADAGADIDNDIDSATGLKIISLYGNNKKPTRDQLSDVDILVYDIQDVGVRFYTYISTLQYAMEACAEYDKELLILDRPNPNGFYVDGPVLDTSLISFVGMQPIPIVYGMTVGEYASMLQGEHWFKNADKLSMKIISCDHYSHSSRYDIDVPPSPNLKTPFSVLLYPSLCLFEGTVVSVGRGTAHPFEQFGAPEFKGGTNYFFIPHSMGGAAKPLYESQECYGELLTVQCRKANCSFTLMWLLDAYKWYPKKDKFFNSFFEKLAGTHTLRYQIVNGWSEERIKKSWQDDLDNFKKIRKKYLLYADF